MSHSRQTQHYGLPLYNGSDIINPLTDFNNANEDIDEAIYDANENAADAKTIAQTAAGNVSQYDSRIASLESDMSGFNASIDATQSMIAPTFNPLKVDGYNEGDKVIYDNKYYEFIRNHSGAWNASDVKEITVSEIIGEGVGDYDARITAAQNTADAAVAAAAVADGKAVSADAKAVSAQSDATRALEEIATMGGDGWEDVFCIIRKDSGIWEILDNTGHQPSHVAGVEVNDTTGLLEVSFDKTYEKVGTCLVTCDETYGAMGIVVGCSVAANKAILKGGISRNLSGCVTINPDHSCSLLSGANGDFKSIAWDSSNNVFNVVLKDEFATVVPLAINITPIGSSNTYTGGITASSYPGRFAIKPISTLPSGNSSFSVSIAPKPFASFADWDDNSVANLFLYAKMKKVSE